VCDIGKHYDEQQNNFVLYTKDLEDFANCMGMKTLLAFFGAHACGAVTRADSITLQLVVLLEAHRAVLAEAGQADGIILCERAWSISP
jgi:hypothetical protein